MDTLRIALDWTPNTNHAPILVALAHDHYKANNLDVQLLSPATDDYDTTPATKLARGEVEIAVCPSESIISHRYSSHPAPLKAVATLLAKDASAIAVLKSSGITRPRELDGKRYASYGARFEDATVRALVKADGGRGDFEIVNPPKLGIWGALMEGKADATWIFPAWEGVEARQKGVEVRCFSLEEHGVPYGYSPVVAVNEEWLEQEGRENVLSRFVAATRRGADDVVEDSDETMRVVEGYVDVSEKALVRQSLCVLLEGGCFGRRGSWGRMDAGRCAAWVDWLRKEGLLKHRDGSDIINLDVGRTFDDEYVS